MNKKSDSQPSPADDKAQDMFSSAGPVEMDESDRAGGTGSQGTPYFGICQRQSDNSIKADNAGKFFTTTNEGVIEIHDKLEVVTLQSCPRATRFGDQNQVVCRSYDGQAGSSGRNCRDCEYYSFSDSKVPKERRCKNSYVLLCTSADDLDAEPFFLQITPAGIKDWRSYAGELQNRYRRPIFSVITKITTVERRANLGKSFVPVFEAVKAFNNAETARIREVRKREAYRFDPTDQPSSNGYEDEDSDPSTVRERNHFLQD